MVEDIEFRGGASTSYFEKGHRAVCHFLTSMDLERESLGVLELHAGQYAFALYQVAEVKFTIKDGPGEFYWAGQMDRWHKAIDELGKGNKDCLADEIYYDAVRLLRDPDSTAEEKNLGLALRKLYNRLIVGI